MDSFWVSDNSPSPPYGDTFVTLTTLVLKTKRLTIGTDVCNPYTRHPAVLASAFMALDNLSSGRMILGLAPGGPSQLRQFGIKAWNKPVETLKESVEVIRKLISGTKVSMKGASFDLQNVILKRHRRKIPIYLAARSPRMLKLVGQLADGGLLTSPYGHFRYAVQTIRESLRRNNRTSSQVDIVNVLDFSVSKSSSEAKDFIREQCALRIHHLPPYMLEMVGMKRDYREKIGKTIHDGEIEKAARFVTDEVIDKVAVAGSSQECIQKCRKFIEAGANHLIFFAPYGPDRTEAVRLVCEEIVPKLRTIN